MRGIAIATGPNFGPNGEGLTVLDLDSPEAAERIVELGIYDLDGHPGPQWTTSEGKRQLAFAYVPELKNRARYLDGLDIRGQGGFCIVPPSHHESGVQYAFIDPEGLYSDPREWMPPVMPETLVNYVRFSSVAESNASPGKLPERQQRGVAAMLAAVKKGQYIAQGDRNRALFQEVGFELGKLGLPVTLLELALRCISYEAFGRDAISETDLVAGIHNAANLDPEAMDSRDRLQILRQWVDPRVSGIVRTDQEPVNYGFTLDDGHALWVLASQASEPSKFRSAGANVGLKVPTIDKNSAMSHSFLRSILWAEAKVIEGPSVSMDIFTALIGYLESTGIDTENVTTVENGRLYPREESVRPSHPRPHLQSADRAPRPPKSFDHDVIVIAPEAFTTFIREDRAYQNAFPSGVQRLVQELGGAYVEKLSWASDRNKRTQHPAFMLPAAIFDLEAINAEHEQRIEEYDPTQDFFANRHKYKA